MGEAVMPEGDRLRGLHVREPGHDRRGMRSRLRDKRALELTKSRLEIRAGIAHPEPEIGHDLVVARTCGVKPAGRRADQLRQSCLDIEVDVLERAFELERSVADLLLDRIEPLQNGLAIAFFDDALLRKHANMRARAFKVLPRHAFVEVDGGRYFLHDPVGAGFKTSAPHPVFAHESLVTLKRTLILAGLGLAATLSVLYV